MSEKRSVHPRISVSQISSYNWTLEQDLAYLKEEDIPGIGVMYPKIADDPDGALAALRASGLACSCVTASARGNLLDPPGEHESPALYALQPSIDFAAAIRGVPCYFTSGPTPERMPTDEAFDLLVAAMPPVIDYARQRGVYLAIEHNNTATRYNGFVHTLRDAIELSQATGLGICLEIQNCWTERHLEEMFRENMDRFAVVQVSDYRTGEPSLLNRRVLGDGSIPLEWMLGLLLDAGFKGWFEIETLGPAIEAEGYASATRRSVDWLSERLDRWGV